jgi:hypothetical protein
MTRTPLPVRAQPGAPPLAARPPRAAGGGNANGGTLPGNAAGQQQLIVELAQRLLGLLKAAPAAPRASARAEPGVRQLVYVHGICRHDPGFSDPWWAAMNPFVPSLQPGDLDGNRHEVLWSDLVSPLRLVAAAQTGGKQAEVRLRLRAALQDRLERQLHDATAQARGTERPRTVAAARDLPALPGLDCIDDFTTYLVNDEVRQQILGRFQAVVQPLLQAGAQVEVISHSWGTVVAYEALRLLDADSGFSAGAVLNFFTVGSALSIFEVQQGLLPTSSGGQRPRVVGRWVNLNAHGDIVGGRLQDNPFQVDAEFLNLEPVTCGSFLGLVSPACAHGSYFQPDNVAVNRDIFGAFIES